MKSPNTRTSSAELVQVPAKECCVLERDFIALQLWRVKRAIRAGERLPVTIDFRIVDRIDAEAECRRVVRSAFMASWWAPRHRTSGSFAILVLPFGRGPEPLRLLA